jgi:hypothetical protein
LDQFLNSEETSKQAAAGWAGDRFAVYEKDNSGDVFLAQLTAWDTEVDSKEFFDAYEKRTAKRYPQAKSSTQQPELTTQGHRYSWKTSAGSIVLERRGLHVLILEGIPLGINIDTLVRASW